MKRQVKPTRAELRDTKRRLSIVRQGHKLLQRKQESLMVELFKALEKFRKQEQNTTSAHNVATRNIAIAEMISGRHATWGYAMTRAGTKAVDMKFSSYMGVRLPQYTMINTGGEAPFVPGEQPQSFDAAQAAEKLLENCIALTEAEAVISTLVDEIERTKRRVNALELKVIPQLVEEATFIISRLEEMERESLFSLKRIRAKVCNR